MAAAADSTPAPAGQALLTAADLNTEVNHEPRVADRRLAEALGFERPDRIKSLIERHKEGLARFGEVFTTAVKTSGKGGRPGKTFWLSKRQALYLCTKSEAPLATETTIQMVEVFDAYTEGQLARAEPAPLAPGLMHMMVGSRIVLVDASDYAIGGGEEAVVCSHDGKVTIVRGPLEPKRDSPWMGKRFAAGRWRKAKPGGMQGVSRERPSYTIIGRLIRSGEPRRRMLLPH